jgi:carboxymethylenebutenolidase
MLDDSGVVGMAHLYAQVDLTTNGGTMPAFVAMSSGEAWGGVVVIHEGFGVTPHIKGIVRWLADHGWHAIAPAFFHREGSPAASMEEDDWAVSTMSRLASQRDWPDFDVTLDYLEGSGYPASRIGVVGASIGGSLALYAAAARALGAAVTIDGEGVTRARFGLPPLIELAEDLKTPWLGLYSDLSSDVYLGDVESLEVAASMACVSTDVIRYPGRLIVSEGLGQFYGAFASGPWERTLNWLNRFINRWPDLSSG